MTEFDIREGVIKLWDEFYKSQAVFVKNKYYTKAEINKICKGYNDKKEKLYVPCCDDVIKSDSPEVEFRNYLEFKAKGLKSKKRLKIHKYRPYLKVVKNECNLEEEENILTFILFNPSFANQYMLDETIKNCAYLTFKNKNYNGFEILNLFCLRDSKVNLFPVKYKKIGKEKEFILDKKSASKTAIYYFYKNTLFKDVVLAWGYSEFKTKTAKLRFNKINKKYKTDETKYYELYRTDTKETKPFHFGNAFWSSQKLPFKKSLNAGKIYLQQIDEDEII